MKTLILSAADVETVADMALATTAVEEAFLAYGRGEAQMPAKVYLDLPDIGGDFRAMPARSGDYSGLKWVNSHPHNPERHGLPTVLGTYILSDTATAVPLAILDGTLLTALRTGAAAGVASKYLAPVGARTLGVIGCGAQARHLVDAHRVFFPKIDVLLYDRQPDAAHRVAKITGGRASSLSDTAAADIVCTSTPSREAFLMPEMLATNVHINAIGADAEGKQEVSVEILRKAKVVIDDAAQATHSGEVNVPIHRGEYRPEDIDSSLGEIVAGVTAGRDGDEGWTLFDSTGLAIQDLFLAKECFRVAKERGVGHAIALV